MATPPKSYIRFGAYGALCQFSSASGGIPRNTFEFVDRTVRFLHAAGNAWNVGLWFTDDGKGLSLTRKLAILARDDIQRAVLDIGHTPSSALLRSIFNKEVVENSKYLHDAKSIYARWKKKFFPSSYSKPLILTGSLVNSFLVTRRGSANTAVSFNRSNYSDVYSVYDVDKHPDWGLKLTGDKAKVSEYASALNDTFNDVFSQMMYKWVQNQFPEYTKIVGAAIDQTIKNTTKKIKADSKAEIINKAASLYQVDEMVAEASDEYVEGLEDILDATTEATLDVNQYKEGGISVKTSLSGDIPSSSSLNDILDLLKGGIKNGMIDKDYMKTLYDYYVELGDIDSSRYSLDDLISHLAKLS